MNIEPSLIDILAANVRRYRTSLGYSQEKLAIVCHLHRTYIGSVERRERNITLSTLEVLAKGLGVTPCDLITRRE